MLFQNSLAKQLRLLADCYRMHRADPTTITNIIEHCKTVAIHGETETIYKLDRNIAAMNIKNCLKQLGLTSELHNLDNQTILLIKW